MKKLIKKEYILRLALLFGIGITLLLLYIGSTTVKIRKIESLKALYLETKPDIVALGPTQLKTLPAQYFDVSFVNGSGSQNLGELDYLTRHIFSDHLPALVILGVDLRWFLPEEKKLIQKNMVALENLLGFLNSKNVKTVLFLMPISPSAIDKTKNLTDLTDLQKKIKKIITAHDMAFFDFYDLRQEGSNDCEFINDKTPGEIAQARMLLRMALTEETVQDAVNLSVIGDTIHHAPKECK